MPLYEFEKPDGSRVEAFYAMSDAPRIGAQVVIDGQPCRRVVSSAPGLQPVWFPYWARSLPNTLEIPNRKLENGPNGRGVLVPSQAVEREIMAVHGYVRD